MIRPYDLGATIVGFYWYTMQTPYHTIDGDIYMTFGHGCPIVHFDPFGNDYLADPYAFYQWAHQQQPIFYSPNLNYWVLTSYDDIKAALKDADIFSSRNATDPFTAVTPTTAAIFREGGYAMQRVLLNADAPNHTRIRRHVYAAFTPQRVAALEERIRTCARTHIAAITANPQRRSDIVADLTYTLPAQVIFMLLGLDDDDVPAIKAGSESRVLFTWGKPSDAQQADLARDMVDFWQRAQAFVAKRASAPRDDFTSDLIRLRNGDDAILSMNEIVSVVFGLLLAGHETTTGLLSNAIRRLLEDPQRWQQAHQHPDQLSAIIEEILRFDTSVIAMRRLTTREVTIADQTIPADANVLLLIGAANHDQTHFEDATDFNPQRPNNREHLAFGFGSHYCIGAPLARLEARVVLSELIAALPNAQLASNQTYDYLPNTSFRGPRQLWITW
jgi:cytochrome P450